MSEVGEPVDPSPAVVEGVDELVRDHAVHVRLLVDVVLAQDDLQRHIRSRQTRSRAFGSVKPLSRTHLRRGGVEPAADGAVAVLAREVSVFMHCTEKTSNRHETQTQTPEES